jgi:hypothetical protein
VATQASGLLCSAVGPAAAIIAVWQFSPAMPACAESLVNDSATRQELEKTLVRLAKRLRKVTPKEETAAVALDEVMVLVFRLITNREQAQKLIERLRKLWRPCCGAPFGRPGAGPFGSRSLLLGGPSAHTGSPCRD